MEEKVKNFVFWPFTRLWVHFVIVAVCTFIFSFFSLFLLFVSAKVGLLMLLGDIGCFFVFTYYFRLLFTKIEFSNMEIRIYVGKKCKLNSNIGSYESVYVICGCAIDKLVPYYSSQVYVCFSKNCNLDKILLGPFSVFLQKDSSKCHLLAVPFRKKDIPQLEIFLKEAFPNIKVCFNLDG